MRAKRTEALRSACAASARYASPPRALGPQPCQCSCRETLAICVTNGGYDWSKRYPWIVESALKNRQAKTFVQPRGRSSRAVNQNGAEIVYVGTRWAGNYLIAQCLEKAVAIVVGKQSLRVDRQRRCAS